MDRLNLPSYKAIALVIAVIGWAVIELLLWLLSFIEISFVW